MFYQVIKKKFLFVKTYLMPIWNQKPIVKSRCLKLLLFWKTYLKPTFTIWNMKINAHQGKHISYLVIKMKTFNVPQFYNGFCCYFKSICSSFNNIIELFILFYLHPFPFVHRTILIQFSIIPYFFFHGHPPLNMKMLKIFKVFILHNLIFYPSHLHMIQFWICKPH
jgi:hypothetical protein